MKCIKENLGFYEFGKECEKFENEILNTKGVAKVLISNLDEEIPYSGGIFRREFLGKGIKGNTIVRKDLLYTRTPDNVYAIYQYDNKAE